MHQIITSIITNYNYYHYLLVCISPGMIEQQLVLVLSMYEGTLTY